jgi:hypothetical protein
VIPGSAELPPPKPAGTSVASRADWPNDPDEARKRAKDVDKIWQEQARSGRRLTAEEMQADKLAAGQRGGKAGDFNADRPHRVSPAQLSTSHKLMAKQDSWKEVGEPERRVLSDPPTGYRQPSAAQPYEAAPKTSAASDFWNKINPFNK